MIAPVRTSIGFLFMLAGVPLLAQSADSTSASRMSQYRIGAFASSIRRGVAPLDGPISQATASLKGAELLVRDAGAIGFMARYSTGDLPGPASNLASGVFESIDGRILLGTHTFTLVTGYLTRDFVYPTEERRLGLARAGAQMTFRFEGAGFEINFAGSYIRTPRAAKRDSLEADGIEKRSPA
jgi:hypothetical protein